MLALLQRVSEAAVVVDGETVGAIGRGLLVFVCAERGDTEAEGRLILDKLAKCRIFYDDAGKMNRSLLDVAGGLLIVSQFTLAADTRSGTRPSFTRAAPSDEGRRLYDALVADTRARYADRLAAIETGRFGADMAVRLVNDGPVTIWLHQPPVTHVPTPRPT
ncbi:D-aminoacyl-tRNA deacylase [Derxia lacustris]|uniref:D-aminoacyl-tRNA deacylase n=1 Tax=Derxia lacustris TaxID=764842 RepID=UPI000A176E14